MQLFKEFRIGDLAHVRITIILLITDGVIVHCLFECRSNADIINDQAALLVLEHTVDTSDSLHKIIATHRLIDIHSRQRRHIKARQPHIHDDSDFQGAVIVLELYRKLVLVCLVSDNLTPILGVFVARCHYHSDLAERFPFGAHFKNLAVYLHSDRTGVCNNHSFARQKIRSVIFVMVENIRHKRGNRSVIAEYRFHTPQLVLALLNDTCVSVLRHNVIFLVYQLNSRFVQFELHDTALIVNGAGRTVLDSLGHIININVVTEHLSGTLIL